LQLTARGPIEHGDPDQGITLGLELGHRALVESFVRFSSDAAHRHWGIRQHVHHDG
jgi:hypothetical protein